ncbi:MAG: hypothetical protein KatS3mg011_1346 [Acidimicrobiia bacterium]|jgi:uncharacterized protein YlxP (DUF503 family)|nr:MAG: hypothetical protein KatS3mg011_1346 [Acidimicrobiia bacterium]
MQAAAIRIDLHIPTAGSLKGKRAVVRPLMEGLKKVASVSVAEVDHHDAWQRSAVGVALVAPDARQLERLIDSVGRYLAGCLEVEVVGFRVTYIEEESDGQAWLFPYAKGGFDPAPGDR